MDLARLGETLKLTTYTAGLAAKSGVAYDRSCTYTTFVSLLNRKMTDLLDEKLKPTKHVGTHVCTCVRTYEDTYRGSAKRSSSYGTYRDLPRNLVSHLRRRLRRRYSHRFFLLRNAFCLVA